MPADDESRTDAGAYRRHFPISEANRERARRGIAAARAALETKIAAQATAESDEPDTIEDE